MELWSILRQRLAALSKRRQLDHDLDDEVTFHLAMRERKLREQGMSAGEAHDTARRAFGNTLLMKETTRQVWLFSWLESLFQDFRYGLRLVRRNPLLSAAVVVTLAIGIGLNTAVFTMLDRLALKPRVASDAASFVQVAPEYFDRTGHAQGQQSWLSARDLDAYASNTHALGALAAYWIHGLTVGENGRQQLALGVTCNYFSVYPITRMRLGRRFAPEDCATQGNSPVVILSEELWRERFSADEQIVGKTIRLDRIPFTVIGVVEANYDGRTRGRGIWFPYTMQPVLAPDKNLFADDSAHWLVAVGRLRANASRASAQAELATLAAQVDRLHTGRTTVMHVTNGSLIEDPQNPGQMWLLLLLIMGGLSLVLVLSCADVATLLLSRAAARQQEIAVRISIGASPSRLVRMLIVETLVLAAAAGAISLYLAYEIPILFKQYVTIEPYVDLRPDLSVFAYLAIVTFLVGCAAGASPAAEVLRRDLTIRLKGEDTFLGSDAHSRWRSRDVLIAIQIAASLVLLVGGALFAHTQYDLFTGDPGYETRHVLLASLPIRLRPEATAQFHADLLRRVAALPGVKSVAFTGQNTWNGDAQSQQELRLPGQPAGKGRWITSTGVSPEYFRALEVSILRGREFAVADPPAANIVIVSRKMAALYWRNQDAIGKQIVDSRGMAYQVVGVAADVKAGIFDDPDDMQAYFLRDPRTHGSSLMVRFNGDALSLSKKIGATIREMDPDMIVVPQTIQSMIDDMSDRFWSLARLIIGLGIAAIALAVIGIYGVVAFSVKRRTKEFGIRIALGATGRNILALVLRSSLRSIAVGVGIGLSLAALGAWGLSLSFRGTPLARIGLDPVAFVGVSVLLVVTAFTAMVGPARSASKVDPMVALRHQ
jgi:predicted permease